MARWWLPCVLVACAGSPRASSPPIAPSSPSTQASAAKAEPKPLLVAKSTKYPMRFEPLAKSDIEAREKAFRARNPEPWTKVVFDAYGLLYDVRIEQPTPTAMPKPPEYDDAQMAKDWRAFLERNRDLLGADYPGMQPVTGAREVGWWQMWGSHVIGFAQVSWHGVGYSNGVFFPAAIVVAGHGWPVNIPPPSERTDDQLAAPWVGLAGTLITTYVAHAQPCDPPGGGQYNPCANLKPPVAPPPSKVAYKLARDEVLVQRGVCRYHPPGDDALEIRIAATISVRIRVVHTSSGDGVIGTGGFTSAKPSQARVDAITGEALDAGKCE